MHDDHDMTNSLINLAVTKQEMAALLHLAFLGMGNPSTNTEWMLTRLAVYHTKWAHDLSLHQRDVLALEVVRRFDAVVRSSEGR